MEVGGGGGGGGLEGGRRVVEGEVELGEGWCSDGQSQGELRRPEVGQVQWKREGGPCR